MAVFCLTRRGNLLIQCDGVFDPRFVLKSIANDLLSISGFVGDWDSVYPDYKAYKKNIDNTNRLFIQKKYYIDFDLTIVTIV